VGQTFQASIDEPVLVDGRTVIPRGADVVVKLVDDKESGRLTGRAELALILSSVKVNGRVVDINTQAVTRASESRTGDTAKKAGGGAALGAIIGAIAGGGKGAAIGAAAGAGAGTAVQVVTGGQKVHIPSETRLTFTLDTPVKL
jgi:YmgG-like glycine-zipper protein